MLRARNRYSTHSVVAEESAYQRQRELCQSRLVYRDGLIAISRRQTPAPPAVTRTGGTAGAFSAASGPVGSMAFSLPAGSNRLVRGVRTGYHLTGRGNEVHVVVDLVAPAAQVTALEPGPAGLVLRLGAR